MTPLSFRALVARSRATRAVLLAFAALLGGAVAVHHSGLMDGPMEMGGMHGGDHAAMVACLAILAAGVAVEGLVLIVRRRRRTRPQVRRRIVRRRLPLSVIPAPGRLMLARDGPPRRVTLCVDRR